MHCRKFISLGKGSGLGCRIQLYKQGNGNINILLAGYNIIIDFTVVGIASLFDIEDLEN
jgi:hypothetical protein